MTWIVTDVVRVNAAAPNHLQPAEEPSVILAECIDQVRIRILSNFENGFIFSLLDRKCYIFYIVYEKSQIRATLQIILWQSTELLYSFERASRVFMRRFPLIPEHSHQIMTDTF